MDWGDEGPGRARALRRRELSQFLEIRESEGLLRRHPRMEVPLLARQPRHWLMHDVLSGLGIRCGSTSSQRSRRPRLVYLAEASPLEPAAALRRAGARSGSGRSPRATGSCASSSRTCCCSGASAGVVDMLCHEGTEVAARRVRNAPLACCSPRSTRRSVPVPAARSAQELLADGAPGASRSRSSRGRLDVGPVRPVEAIAGRRVRDRPRVDRRRAASRRAPDGERLGALADRPQPEVTTLLHAVVRLDESEPDRCSACSTARARARRSAATSRPPAGSRAGAGAARPQPAPAEASSPGRDRRGRATGCA